jgi:hypothetical protein
MPVLRNRAELPGIIMLGRDETRRDVNTAIILFLAGFFTSIIYVSNTSGTGTGYGERFGPALMWATGHGLTECVTESNAAVDAFIHRQIDMISPADVSGTLTSELTDFQREHLYLLYAIGIVWWIFGPSWSALTFLIGVFCGTTCVAVYALFRSSLTRRWAIAGVLIFLLAPFHIYSTNGLRDYSKAPFIMTVLAIVTWLVALPEFNARRTMLAAGVCGLFIGLGRGFRYDVELCTPFVVGALILFLPGGLFKNVLSKASSIVILLAAIFVAGLGMSNFMHHRVAVPVHVIAQGLMASYSPHLGIRESFYDFGYTYGSDANAWSIVSDYKHRVLGEASPMPYVSEDHARVGNAYLLDFAKTFPADLMTRGFAAVYTVLNEVPFGEFDIRQLGRDEREAAMKSPRDKGGHLYSDRIAAPPDIQNTLLLTFFRWRNALAQPLNGWGVPITALAILILAAKSVRYGIYMLLFTLYFGGTLALQFHIRHAFHMQAIAIWALLFVLQCAVRACMDPEIRAVVSRTLRSRNDLLRVALPPALALAAAVIALVAPLWIARIVQSNTLHGVFQQYANSDNWVEIPELHPVGDDERGVLRLEIPGFGRADRVPPNAEPGIVYSDYLILLFERPPEGPKPVQFRLNMGSTNMTANDCSRDYAVNLISEGVTAIYIPVLYYNATCTGYSSRFENIEITRDSISCFKNMYRTSVMPRVPNLMTVVMPLPDTWELLPRFERINTKLESRRNWVFEKIGGVPLVWPWP